MSETNTMADRLEQIEKALVTNGAITPEIESIKPETKWERIVYFLRGEKVISGANVDVLKAIALGGGDVQGTMQRYILGTDVKESGLFTIKKIFKWLSLGTITAYLLAAGINIFPMLTTTV